MRLRSSVPTAMLKRIGLWRARMPTPKELEIRRAMERDFVMSYDNLGSDVWYLIDAEWSQQWERFLLYDGPCPGLIHNEGLIDKCTGLPRPGLIHNVHYQGVNAAVWSYLLGMYGGGPAIVRHGEPDIYGEPAEEEQPSDTLLECDLPSTDFEASVDKRDSKGAAPWLSSLRSHSGSRKLIKALGRKRSWSRKDGIQRRHRCHTNDQASFECTTPHDKRQQNKTSEEGGSSCETDLEKNPDLDTKRLVIPQANIRIIDQPRDGHCLFHALSYGLGGKENAEKLRLEISHYILMHPDMQVAGTKLAEWVKYDSGKGISPYATQMAGGVWGGAIEMQAFTQLKDVNVHVFEPCPDGYQRISCFDTGQDGAQTINVLYQGRNHYDSMVSLNVPPQAQQTRYECRM